MIIIKVLIIVIIFKIITTTSIIIIIIIIIITDRYSNLIRSSYRYCFAYCLFIVNSVLVHVDPVCCF